MLGSERTLGSSGTLTLQSPLTVSGGGLAANGVTNDSTLKLTDGVIQTQTLTNNVGRLLDISDAGALVAAGGVTNAGTLQLDDNSIATVGGPLANVGTIRGGGYVGNNLTNNAVGQVQITAGQRLAFQGDANTNAGIISIVSGEVQLDGALTNAASTGLIAASDGILRFSGGLTNNGSLTVSAGRAEVFGDITQGAGGRIVVSGGGTATFYGDVASAGAIEVSAAGSLASSAVFSAPCRGAASRRGPRVHRRGRPPRLQPGGDELRRRRQLRGRGQAGVRIGRHDAGGSVRQSPSERSTVTGWIASSGANGLHALGGPVVRHPGLGKPGWHVLDAEPAGASSGLSWDTTQLYSAGLLKVTSATFLAADFDQDGDVDGADLVKWKAGFGANGGATHMQGDADGDGAVGGGDFLIWQRQLGSAASTAASTAVPEPGAWGLGGALLISVWRRRVGPTPRLNGRRPPSRTGVCVGKLDPFAAKLLDPFRQRGTLCGPASLFANPPLRGAFRVVLISGSFLRGAALVPEGARAPSGQMIHWGSHSEAATPAVGLAMGKLRRRCARRVAPCVLDEALLIGIQLRGSAASMN